MILLFLVKNMFIYLDKYRCWFIEDIDISEGKATLSCLALSFIFSHRVIIPPVGKSHLQVSNKLTGEIAKAFIEDIKIAYDNIVTKRKINN